MAVVNKTAALLPDLTAAKPTPADPRVSHGSHRTSCFTAEITNGDSPNSTFEVARLQSTARVLKLSQIHSSGIAGATDVDLGPEGNPDALVDGGTLAATATIAGASAIALADIAKPLWQLAGLDKDPKAEIPIYLTLKTAATASGLAVVELTYVIV